MAARVGARLPGGHAQATLAAAGRPVAAGAAVVAGSVDWVERDRERDKQVSLQCNE